MEFICCSGLSECQRPLRGDHGRSGGQNTADATDDESTFVLSITREQLLRREK